MTDLEKHNAKITKTRTERLKNAHRPAVMVTHIKGLDIKEITQKLDHILDPDDPVAREYLTYGPIRLKRDWLAFLEHDHQLNLKYGNPANDLAIMHQIKTKIKGKYIFILHHHYRDVTPLDFKPIKRSLRHVKDVRRKQLKNAVLGYLSKKDIATLKFALSPARTPKGYKTRYSRLHRALFK